jgi:hypothetical protein
LKDNQHEEGSKKKFYFHLLHAGFLLGLLSSPEEGDNICHRTVCLI